MSFTAAGAPSDLLRCRTAQIYAASRLEVAAFALTAWSITNLWASPAKCCPAITPSKPEAASQPTRSNGSKIPRWRRLARSASNPSRISEEKLPASGSSFNAISSAMLQSHSRRGCVGALPAAAQISGTWKLDHWWMRTTRGRSPPIGTKPQSWAKD